MPRERRERFERPGLSVFDIFTRSQWAGLGTDRFDLEPGVLSQLMGINEATSLAEVAQVFGPLCRLINLRLESQRMATAELDRALFGRVRALPPFIVAVAGSVAVGKSTFARILHALLSRGSIRRSVEIVATDGFLFPTAVLEERALLRRKGFPETYDLHRMLDFLADLKAGRPTLEVPVYSHKRYDIVPGEFQTVRHPDIVIFEGLNVLQTAATNTVVASDYFDFSIYLDADPAIVEDWYIDRFMVLQKTVFRQAASYFHDYQDLTPAAIREVARDIWRATNLPNLRQNILPTRNRAGVVFRKGKTHAVEEIWLRRQGR